MSKAQRQHRRHCWKSTRSRPKPNLRTSSKPKLSATQATVCGPRRVGGDQGRCLVAKPSTPFLSTRWAASLRRTISGVMSDWVADVNHSHNLVVLRTPPGRLTWLLRRSTEPGSPTSSVRSPVTTPWWLSPLSRSPVSASQNGCGHSPGSPEVPHVRNPQTHREKHHNHEGRATHSGGLDTSIILRWLQETYDADVITFTADLGQEEVEPAAPRRSRWAFPKNIHIEDLREEFVRDFVYPMFRANTIYEGEYLLEPRSPVRFAKRLVEIAAEHGADAVSHGHRQSNDQVGSNSARTPCRQRSRSSHPGVNGNSAAAKLRWMRAPTRHPDRDEARRSRRSRWTPTCCTSASKVATEDPFTEPPSEMWRWSVGGDAPNERPISTSPHGRHRRHRRQG